MLTQQATYILFKSRDVIYSFWLPSGQTPQFNSSFSEFTYF